MNTELKSRNLQIDLMKGLCIIFVVLGHSSIPFFPNFIVLFHMPVFFMISGFLFNPNNSSSFKSSLYYVKKKIKSLWFPFLLWNSIFILLNNFFILTNIYTTNPSITPFAQDYLSLSEIIAGIIKSSLFAEDTLLGGTFWFLKLLFIVSILYNTVEYFLYSFFKNKEKFRIILQTIISIILLSTGYFMNIKKISFFSIGAVCSVYILIHIGRFLKHFSSASYPIWLLPLSFLFLLFLSFYGKIDLNHNTYENPFFLLLVSFSGWLFIYSLAKLISSFSATAKYLSIIGKNSLSIMILHFLCFKLVNLLQVYLYHLPCEYIGCFPTLFASPLWWILYTIVGVTLPVILNIVRIKIISYFHASKK